MTETTSSNPGSSGLAEVDWETAGQQMIRNEVACIAERWKWPPDAILHMPTRTRRSYWHRVIEFVEQEKSAYRKQG